MAIPWCGVIIGKKNFFHLRSKFTSSLADHEELLVEHQQLASRHEQLLQESESRREGLERVMREEAARHSLQSQEQTQLILQLRQEIEEVTSAFKKQLHGLQEEHGKVRCCAWSLVVYTYTVKQPLHKMWSSQYQSDVQSIIGPIV